MGLYGQKHWQDRKPLVPLPDMPKDLAEKVDKSLKEDPVQAEEASAEILKAGHLWGNVLILLK